MVVCSLQLGGSLAPTLSNLVEWLQQNSSFDVAEESAALVHSKVCVIKHIFRTIQ